MLSWQQVRHRRKGDRDPISLSMQPSDTAPHAPKNTMPAGSTLSRGAKISSLMYSKLSGVGLGPNLSQCQFQLRSMSVAITL